MYKLLRLYRYIAGDANMQRSVQRLFLDWTLL